MIMRKIYVVVGLVAAACRHPAPVTIREYIPGAYVKQSESDYSKAYDTLRISVYDEVGNTYLVAQRTGYQLIQNGRLQPKQYKSDKEVAVYDEGTNQLQGMNSGRLFIFSPEHGTLLAGPAQYTKIK